MLRQSATYPRPELLVEPDWLAKRLTDRSLRDARSPDEYSARVLSPDARQEGRIPGTVNVEWKENVAGPNREFKPADELRAMYAAKGIMTEKEIVVHCGAGGRAAQSLFTLKLLGFPKVRIYYGSFRDYSNLPHVPIER